MHFPRFHWQSSSPSGALAACCRLISPPIFDTQGSAMPCSSGGVGWCLRRGRVLWKCGSLSKAALMARRLA